MFRHVMFYLNKNKPAVYEAVKTCTALCLQRNIKPVFFEEDRHQIAEYISGFLGDVSFLAAPDKGMIDAIFVFGGDGTVLRALDSYVQHDIPMLGINLGRMGFLLETEVDELSQALDDLISGDYSIERRLMLRVEGYCNGRNILAYATNEVAVSRGLSQRMIAMDAYVGDMLVDHYIADGLVLSSPTGSTAYSLSAGGPIVSPDVQCFVLCPICPHSLQSRPIVLSSEHEVRLCIHMKEMREGIQISVDGQAICGMRNHEQISITRSKTDAQLIRFRKEKNYFSLLKEKLSQWSL